MSLANEQLHVCLVDEMMDQEHKVVLLALSLLYLFISSMSFYQFGTEILVNYLTRDLTAYRELLTEQKPSDMYAELVASENLEDIPTIQWKLLCEQAMLESDFETAKKVNSFV